MRTSSNVHESDDGLLSDRRCGTWDRVGGWRGTVGTASGESAKVAESDDCDVGQRRVKRSNALLLSDQSTHAAIHLRCMGLL
jgi:hypothetical protein